MRVAVALPSLPAGTPLRLALDAVVAGLTERGVEVEAFAEMERVREGTEVPIHHYLRFPERHRDRAFDRGLWPLGRDARPWEPAWILSRRFSGVAWVVDGPLHHAVLGNIAMPGHWREYGRLVEERFGEEAGGVLELFASGWGTRAAYRHLDPVPALLRAQGSVLAADGRLAVEMEGCGGPPASVLPLPIVPAPTEGAESPRPRAVAISVDVVRPRRVMAGIADVLERHPDLDLRIAVPEPTYHVRLAPAAHAAGIFGGVHWMLSPGARALLREVDRSDIVLLLDVEVTAADRGLLERALARGSTAVALDIPALRDVPEPPLVKLMPGVRLGGSLAVALDALLEQKDLRRGLGAAGRRWTRSRPTPEVVSEQLLEHLCDSTPLRRATGARGPVWPEVRDALLTDAVPAGAAPATRRLVEEIVGSILPAVAAAGPGHP